MKNKGLFIELVSIKENKDTVCNGCDSFKDCIYLSDSFDVAHKSIKDIKMSHVFLIIQNVSNNTLYLNCSDFMAVNEEGFSCKGISLCNDCANRDSYETKSYHLLPKLKVKFLIAFPICNIASIIFNDGYDDRYNFKLIVNPNTSNEPTIGELKIRLNEKNEIIGELRKNISKLENKIKEYEKENREYKKENERLNNLSRQTNNFSTSIKRSHEELLCKYEIIEDDDYYRIISLEKEDTVSFNREFDKSKANHNWINAGQALISLRADNAIGYMMDGRTIIKCPVSGIFEYDNNKMIGYKEEICRVRKYPQESKSTVLEEIEREEIKEAVYKKERKKMIEREALDELIEEGKVFNVYTKKDGNRTAIPMDIATAVWNRDGGKCCMCGSRENLEFDHIIPISKGGATTFRNLQILCKNCNIKKSDNI